MTEYEYIKATNRVKVSAALTILRDVLAGDDCGITDDELKSIVKPLRDIETKLFSSFEIQAPS